MAQDFNIFIGIITSQLVDAKIAMEIMESLLALAFAWTHLPRVPHFIQDPFGSLAGAAGSGLSRRGSRAKASKKIPRWYPQQQQQH